METEPIMKNNHHVWFTRREYKTPIERKVRNMGAFIIRVNAVDHQELHANVPPPPKPAPEHLHDLYQFMQEHDHSHEQLDGIGWSIAWANDRRLFDLEESLTEQLNYLSGDYRR